MENLTKMNFQLGKILSVVTGRLLSENHITGVYQLLQFMTGETLFTHQLPRASEQCKPFILENYPQLRDVDYSQLNAAIEKANGDESEILKNWLNDYAYPKYGEYLTISILPEGAKNPQHPIEELQKMVDRK